MKSVECLSTKDRREEVLWLHDVYVYPVYAPDQGPPKVCRFYFKSWSELLGTLINFACTLSMTIAYFFPITWIELKLYSRKEGLRHIHVRLHERCLEDLNQDNVDSETLWSSNMTCTSWEEFLSESDMNDNGTGPYACTISSIDDNMPLIFMDVQLIKWLIGVGLLIAILAHFILLAKCIHRNSVWNLHATVLLIGVILIWFPSLLSMYIPYQFRIENVSMKTTITGGLKFCSRRHSTIRSTARSNHR